MNPTRNITDLPMEVLYLIFKNLPSLKEQLSLVQIHPHIGLAFSCHYGQTFEILNVRDLTVLEWGVLLPLCGSGVKQINSNNSFNDDIAKLVVQHCPNLVSMYFIVNNSNINAVKSLLGNVKSLEIISLFNTTEPTRKNYFGIVELLRFQSNLKKLELMHFSGDELLEVRNLVTLEDLEISGCSDDSINIQELVFRLKKLRNLKIECQGFSALTKFKGVPCPALRTLDLNFSHYWCSGLFKENPGIPGLLKWILSHAETLEILDLKLEFAEFAPDTVICKILSKCKYLRYLYMPVNTFKNGFAHRVIKIVSENGVTSKDRPLKFNFYNKLIHDRILEVMGESPVNELITFKNYITEL